MVSGRDEIDPLIPSPGPVTFFGHRHLQGGFVLTGEISEAYHPGYRTVGTPESSDWPLRKDRRYLINPGSVGQPRDGDWRAAFSVFDSEAWVVFFYRVPYKPPAVGGENFGAHLRHHLAHPLPPRARKPSVPI